jgi:hypothetical protein
LNYSQLIDAKGLVRSPDCIPDQCFPPVSPQRNTKSHFSYRGIPTYEHVYRPAKVYGEERNAIPGKLLSRKIICLHALLADTVRKHSFYVLKY